MDLDAIREEALAAIAAAPDAAAIEALRVHYLGRKSLLVAGLREIGQLDADKRAAAGAKVNHVKGVIDRALEARGEALRAAREGSLATREWLDLSLPAEAPRRGHLHPITLVENELEDLFRGMGFRVVDGPWVEDECHNFDALNIPRDHPARDMQDTFWLSDGNLLRTHTSPVQIRAMEPVKAADPRDRRPAASSGTRPSTRRTRTASTRSRGSSWTGSERPATSSTRSGRSSPRSSARKVEVRLRPSFFPFTEPSFEWTSAAAAAGWSCCGCGLVHPKVLGRAASTRRSGPASRSASGSTGSRCCATGSTTSAGSTAATCASWGSSDAPEATLARRLTST